MAVYDSNLLLYNTPNTSVVSGAGQAGLYTGNWFTFGTGHVGPGEGLSFRASIGTTSGSNTQTLQLIYEFSDDQSVMKETVTRLITGTDGGTGTSGGYLVTGLRNSFYTRVTPRTNYYRVRLLSTGTTASWGVVTVGVDAGDFNSLR